jgi:hypothetical protein
VFEELIQVERQMLRSCDRSTLVYMSQCDSDEVAGDAGHKSDPSVFAPVRGHIDDPNTAGQSSSAFNSTRMKHCANEPSLSEESERDTNVFRSSTDLAPTHRAMRNFPSFKEPYHLFCRPSDSLVLACDMLASQVYTQISGTSMTSRASSIWPHWLQGQLHLRQCTPKDLHRFMPVVGSSAASGGSIVLLTSAQLPASVS